MSADKMPKLPEPRHSFYIGNGKKPTSKYTAFHADQMHTYAREYAAEQTRELVEAAKTSLCVLCALQDANDWHPNMRKDIEFAIEGNRALIAKHKATGEQP